MLYMIYIARGEHSTAHYAICTGFMALGAMLPGMWSGWLQQLLGYQHFFIWVLLATIPGFIVTALIPLDAEFRKKKTVVAQASPPVCFDSHRRDARATTLSYAQIQVLRDFGVYGLFEVSLGGERFGDVIDRAEFHRSFDAAEFVDAGDHDHFGTRADTRQACEDVETVDSGAQVNIEQHALRLFFFEQAQCFTGRVRRKDFGIEMSLEMVRQEVAQVGFVVHDQQFHMGRWCREPFNAHASLVPWLP